MNGYRTYKVIKKVQESHSVVSIYLADAAGAPLPSYQPGQHLQFRLTIPGQEIPVYRNYSFSDAYHPSCYRISIKKEPPPRDRPDLPPGLVSTFFSDAVQAGDELQAKGPQGSFFLDPAQKDPVVFFAGGIGVTPLLSMVKSISHAQPDRELYFIYGVNEKKDHSFRGELSDLRRDHPNFRFMTFYTIVGPGDVRALDFDYEGFIDMEILLKEAGHLRMNHYICGPGGMMHFVKGSLLRMGVPENKIHIESFSAGMAGAPAVSEVAGAPAVSEVAVTPEVSEVPGSLYIEFGHAGKRLRWDHRYPSILSFAEAHDIEISSGCLFGDCGTCLTKVIAGKVKYMHPTLIQPPADSCLPCSCIPVSNIILEA